MTKIREVQLNLLNLSSENPRQIAASSADDAALVASIRAHGLLQPLLVRGVVDNTGDYDHFVVIDGNRRLAALHEIHAEDQESVLVPVIVDESSNQFELATAANIIRAAMHPLDECDAILRLIGSEQEIDTKGVALRFGRPERWVQQRMALAGLSERARKMFRENIIGIGTAMALTLGDHAKQDGFLKSVRDADDWRLKPDYIRSIFTEKKIPGERALFDLALYPKESIQSDLFSEQVYLLDVPAFQKLQKAAFDELVAGVKAEGWNEVVVFRPGEESYPTTSRYVATEGRVKKADRPKLTAFVYYGGDHAVRVERGYALKKQVKAEKVKKNGVHTEDTAKVEDVKPVSPADLTGKQTEQLQDMMAQAVKEQCLAFDTVALWTLISPLLPKVMAPWTRRLFIAPSTRIKPADAPMPFDEKQLAEVKIPQTLAEFEDLVAKDRMRLVRIASMFAVAPTDPANVLKEWDLEGWFRPDEAFLKGWRKDQLIVFARKIGAPNLIPEASKADWVANVKGWLSEGDVDPPPPHSFIETTAAVEEAAEEDDTSDPDASVTDTPPGKENPVGVSPQAAK